MDRRQPYLPLATFAAPVMAGSFAMVLLAVVVIAVAFVASQIVFGALATLPFYDGGPVPLVMNRLQVIVYLASFVPPMLLLMIWTRRQHDRPAQSLLGTAPVFARQFRLALGAVVMLSIVLTVAPPWMPFTDHERINPVLPWLLWLLPMAGLVLLQVSAEELLFRGYLMQEIAARWRSPWAWMVAPSVIFGLLHIPNGRTPGEGAMLALWITGFALISSDLTARTGTLAGSIVLHWFNNLGSMLVNSENGGLFERVVLFVWPSDISGLTDLTVAEVLSPGGLIGTAIGLMPVVVTWLAIRVALRR